MTYDYNNDLIKENKELLSIMGSVRNSFSNNAKEPTPSGKEISIANYRGMRETKQKT